MLNKILILLISFFIVGCESDAVRIESWELTKSIAICNENGSKVSYILKFNNLRFARVRCDNGLFEIIKE